MDINHLDLEDPNAIPDYLQALVKLNELQRMTEDLDAELADSQQMMRDMKSLFNKMQKMRHRQPVAESVNEAQHEGFAQFLQAAPPQLLMQDMPANTTEIDLDNLIATMKVYTEELRKNLDAKPRAAVPARSVDVMDLDGYASSLDQLVKRLANLKLQKPDAGNKNAELEAKLQQLCEDGNSFTKMVETMKRQREAQAPLGPETSTNPLVYDNLVNKLLADINEVTYLLKNKN